jgi:ribonuclease HII
MKFPTYKYEQQKLLEGLTLVAGCDEVGIGPLAGPVVAAAVIIDPQSIAGRRTKSKWWHRVRDSKTTNEKERAELVNFISDHCLSVSVSEVAHETVDKLNIFHAAQLAMRNAIDGLTLKPQFVFVDGRHSVPNISVAQQAVVDGDAKILSISAASIVAKVARDKLLNALHELYPVYGFDQHKGYSTSVHRNAIRKHGVSPVHRRSFAFVKQYLGVV